jgi:hypothetical protein
MGIISVGFNTTDDTTDHIFYICQILEKKWEYNETVHKLFIDFKKHRCIDNIKIDLGEI